MAQKTLGKRHPTEPALEESDDQSQASQSSTSSVKDECSLALSKIMAETCRASLPTTIQKQLKAQEEQARLQAAAEAKAQAEAMALIQEKKNHRLSVIMASGMILLTLLSFVWLLYAPFFLAFAVNMGWIDEQTSLKIDAASSLRAQVMTRNTQTSVELPKKTANLPAEVKQDEKSQLEFTFYRELPKANIQLAAKPLAVRTKAPTYLQLAAINNEKDAQNERRRLAAKGYLVQMTQQTNAKNAPVYVLRMGPYDDQRVLNRLKVELQKLGVEAAEVSVSSVIKTVNQVTLGSAPTRQGQTTQHLDRAVIPKTEVKTATATKPTLPFGVSPPEPTSAPRAEAPKKP
jgi:hypothetical protein